jgi:hypothetical protein
MAAAAAYIKIYVLSLECTAAASLLHCYCFIASGFVFLVIFAGWLRSN